MTDAVVKDITEKRIENAFPLRIWGEHSRNLACSYELNSDDNATLRLLENGGIGHIELLSVEEKPFRRDFLYSRTWEGGHVITARGYVYDGEVEVYSWKGRDPSLQLNREERRVVFELARVSMYHVGKRRGLCEPPPKKEPATLDEAMIRHWERIRLLSLRPMTLDDLEKFYDLLRDNVPRY
ncbi:hypothetical protein J4447_00455 [Candidatus Pacearchaeota archaeon]|nr:hypothetical protein [Candidatus Pacearchaeota archaeon]